MKQRIVTLNPGWAIGIGFCLLLLLSAAAAISLWHAHFASDDGRIGITQKEIRDINTALRFCEYDTQQRVTNLLQLMDGADDPNWKGPYMSVDTDFRDAWGAPYLLLHDQKYSCVTSSNLQERIEAER